MRSIKELKRKGNPKRFDFESVATETNQEAIARVTAFCKGCPDALEELSDGSVYHGSKLDGKPNGTGFVAVFADEERTVLE